MSLKEDLGWFGEGDPGFATIKCNCGFPIFRIRCEEEGGIFGSFSAASCPSCGRIFKPKGSYMALRINGELQMVFQDAQAEKLIAAKAALKQLQASGDPTIDDVVAAVEPVSPQLAGWVKSLDKCQGVMTLIGLIVAIIGLILQQLDAEQATQINQTIVNINETICKVEQAQ